MAASVVRASYYGGGAVEPTTGANAETGITMSREDSQTGATAIPIPTSAGTNFSWYKLIALDVTTTGTTTINNRQVARSSTPPAGLGMLFAATSGYVQPTSANAPADSATGDSATPAGWTLLTTSYQTYSTWNVGTSSGRNGGFFKIDLGVSSTATYTGGPGAAISLPNVLVQYDEF